MATTETQPKHEITKPHVILFASPGMGHVIPMSELARLLASPCHNFMVTIITKSPWASSSEKDKESFLSSFPSSVNVIFLPSTDHQSLNSFIVNDIFGSTLRSLPDLREAIGTVKSLSGIDALIADFLSVDAITIAREFFVPFYVFFPTNLMALSFLLECRRIDHQTEMEFRDMPSIKLPGWCVEVAGIDLGEAFQERNSEAYKMSLHMSNKIHEADGILCNSFSGMELKLADLMMENNTKRPPVYTIGPLVWSMPDKQVNVSGVMEWLHQQPSGSVLFISFGSEGTLSSEQIMELSWGLELSKQRFLWVIKNPGDLKDGTLLPEGFIERNNEVGLVVQSWVAQREVLGHSSTGGFLTHCGWNSVLESIMSSVPMIAWPLHADQGINATMLVKGFGVALRPEVQDDQREGVVPRDAIATAVKELMEGEAGREARARALELKASGDRALAEDGSSFKNLVKWKNSLYKYCL